MTTPPVSGPITAVTQSTRTIVVDLGVVSSPGAPGTPGSPGTPGPPGPEGPPGPAGLTYIHTQAVLAYVWSVQHNLNKHPSVHVEDAGGTVIYGTVVHQDNNNLTITFAVNATGKAYCV